MRSWMKAHRSTSGLLIGIFVAFAAPLGIAVGTYSHPVGTYSHPKPAIFHGSISGTVMDDRGRPAAVCVRAYNFEAHGRGVRVYTNSETGHYRIDFLDTGDYKVLFQDCDTYAPRFQAQWYPHATDFDHATVVPVRNYFDTSRVDVVMESLPAPDVGITDLTVTKKSIETDYGTLPSTGWTRRIDVTVKNLGTQAAIHSELSVWVEGATEGSAGIGYAEIEVSPGKQLRKSFDWNAPGSIGDFTVYACVSTYRDFNPTNDLMSTSAYVGAGGTGVGIEGPRIFSGPTPSCYAYYYGSR